MSDNLSDYVSTSQAADMLGVRRTSINHLLLDGRLKGRKVGTVWMVYLPSLQEYYRNKSAAGRPRSGDPQIE